ncbi:MAG: ferritin family protein [Planctomycetota bacterium]|jgi:rubrerythrin
MAGSGYLKSLEKAMEFEWEGHAFYEEAMGKSTHPLTKGVFELLRDEEKKHAEYLLSLHGMVGAEDGGWPAEITLSKDKDFKLLFKEASENIDKHVNISTDEKEAFQFALDMENKSRDMYLGFKKEATVPQEEQLFGLLADWEQAHADFVGDFLNFFDSEGLYMNE